MRVDGCFRSRFRRARSPPPPGSDDAARSRLGKSDFVFVRRERCRFGRPPLRRGDPEFVPHCCAGGTRAARCSDRCGEELRLFRCHGLDAGRSPSGRATRSEQRFGSCATSGEQRAEIVNSALAALDATAEMFVPLPEYGHLPLAIRCMGIDDLRTALTSVAADLNCNVVGAYPAPVYLRRSG